MDEKPVVSARLPTGYGEFQIALFNGNPQGKEHIALIKGEVRGKRGVLTRLHSECFTGDVLGSLRCDCGEQLHLALQAIAVEEQGVLLYLRQEGRGIGLQDKLAAYNLQDKGLDTVEANLVLGHQADERDYSPAAGMLRSLGVESVRLLTNNPEKVNELAKLGIPVEERIPLKGTVTQENARYLLTKARRLHHLLDTDSLFESLDEHKQGEV